MTQIILFNKPFGVLSQFTDKKNPSPRATLSDFIVVKNVYPSGRLDRDSEGLLLLTDNGRLQAQLTNPKNKIEKTYLVQVEGSPSNEDILPLKKGVMLKDGITKPAQVKLIEAPKLWDRDPPIRVRQSIPDKWLEIRISEGRNRQVRRMTAAIGFPTLRLVRVAIGEFRLNDLALGEWRSISSHFKK